MQIMNLLDLNTMKKSNGSRLSKLMLYSVLLFTVVGTSNSNKFKNPDYYKNITPPNCQEVSEGLFFDKTEITNLSWLEYLHWNSKVFGKNSAEYKAAMPDTSVWSDFDKGLISLDTFRLRSIAYREQPVVGISYVQAVEFGNWRTDRVLEYLLIKNNIIDEHADQNSTNYFTALNYFSGKFMNYTPDPLVTHVATFRLPSRSEWLEAMKFADLSDQKFFTDCKKKSCEPCKSMLPDIHSKEQAVDGAQMLGSLSRRATAGCHAEKGTLYNMRGNVAEIIAEPNISMGGSWAQTHQEIMNQLEIGFINANAWTGVRYACEWKPASSFTEHP